MRVRFDGVCAELTLRPKIAAIATGRLTEEIALAELERHDARLDELDIEAALNFATHVLSNSARFWSERSLEQKQRFQRILFLEGLRLTGQFWNPLQPV